MVQKTKQRLYNILRWSERYMKTDMVYLAESNFWLLFGRLVSLVSGFGLTILLANLLTQEAFGTYKYILAGAGIVGAFTLNGLGSGLTRALSRGHQNVIPSAYRTGLLYALPASIGALCVGGYYFYMGNSLLGWSFIAIGLLNPHQSALTITKSLFSSTGDFKTAVLYNNIRNIVQVAAIGMIVVLTRNVLAIAVGYLAISVFMGYITYRHSIKVLGITDDPTHHKDVIAYSRHMSVLATLQIVMAQLDQFLLWHFVGPAALAVYSIAQGPIREVRAFTDSIGAIALPKLAAKSKTDAERSMREKTRYLFMIYVPVALLYIAGAPLLFHVFFPKYINAIFASQLFALTIVFQSRTLADVFLFSHGNIKDRYVITVPSQIARAVLFLIFIPLYGLYGAIIANILAELANALAIGYGYRRHKRIHGI
jgi:O-antigen/teichoic acid export membrane protein